MGTLYIVSTPIGNLKDISQRAVDTLRVVDLILVEDTRRSGRLLTALEISKPLLSFHEHNEKQRQSEIIQRLKQGDNIALISDAGTPTIADPGFKLVRESAKEEINVVAVPGASAILAALVSSGLPTDSFFFLGYIPKKEGKRKKYFEKISNLLNEVKTTVIMLETPHRISKSLAEISNLFPEKDLVIGRELTKLNEEVMRSKAKDILDKLGKKQLKGEIVVLLN